MRWPSLRPFVGMLAGWGVEEQLEVGRLCLVVALTGTKECILERGRIWEDLQAMSSRLGVETAPKGNSYEELAIVETSFVRHSFLDREGDTLLNLYTESSSQSSIPLYRRES